MIDEELLISYLQEQKRKYQEQMIILDREVENLSGDISQHEYILTNTMWHSVKNIVQVHTDLIERIKNREFDVEIANMAENRILSVKVREIDKLLNDLYEGIDEHYTEQSNKDDELAIARAEAQLELITSIIKEIERI